MDAARQASPRRVPPGPCRCSASGLRPREPSSRSSSAAIDGQGGFAVVETDDPTLIAKDAATFSPWFDFGVHPVLEIADTAMIDATAVEFLASID